MISIFSSLFAAFVTLPFLLYVLIFVSVKKVTKKHKKAVHVAIDSSTWLFVLSVHFLIVTIWQVSLFWLILVALLILAILATVLQWNMHGEVELKRVFKAFWRFTFLLFGTLYVTLLFLGIIFSVSGSLTV